MPRALLVTVILLVLPACAPSVHGVIKDEGFFYDVRGYTVAYVDKEKKFFVNDDWLIDDWKYNKTNEEFERKKGKAYYGTILIDYNDDGTDEEQQGYFFDLKLVHKKTDGVIWIQTFYLSPKNREKRLDVLLESYAGSLAGTGYYAEGNVYSLLHLKERKYATKIVKQEEMKLGGYKAIRATIEIIDIDQQKVDPDMPGDRLEVVLAKTPQITIVYDLMINDHLQKRGKGVLLLGYLNSASHFEECLADFDAFIKTISFFDPKMP